MQSTCKNCGIVYEHGSSSQGKYCSNACQQIFQTKQRIQKWINEGIDPAPKAIRSCLLLMKNYECEICRTVLWNDIPVTLEVDHIDGNHQNNHINNLRLICPNCHSQTETYKNKNKGNGRGYRRKKPL